MFQFAYPMLSFKIFFKNCISFLKDNFFHPIINITLAQKFSKNEEVRSLVFFTIMLVWMVLCKYLASSHPNSLYFFIYLACILFIIACSSLGLLLCLFNLDNFYRPLVPQYPWNIWIDRIIPITFLFTPLVFTLIVSPLGTWFLNFIFLLLLHILIITPLLKKWSLLRRWTTSFEEIPETSWRHPRIYAHISLAMIYPLVWGIYFSAIRYFNLGYSVDLVNHYLFNANLISLIIFLSPSLFYWLLALRILFNDLRNYLWNEFISLLFSIHKLLLAKDIYFIFAKKLHRLTFILDMFIIRDSPICELYPSWDKFLYYIYRPFLVPGIIFTFFIMEILINNGIMHFSIYLIFFYPLIKGLVYCIHTYATSQLAYDVCFSDFITGNWQKPKYPSQFWEYISDPEYHFGVKITPDNLSAFEEFSDKYSWKVRKINKFRHTLQLRLRTVGRRSVLDLATGQFMYRQTGVPRRLCVQLAANYYCMHGVRWVHGTARQLHSATALFVKDPLDFITLLNLGWKNFQTIEKYQKGIDFPSPNKLYKPPIPERIPIKPKNISEFVESNLAITLSSAFPNIGTFSEMFAYYGSFLPIEANQKYADVIIHMSGKNQYLLGIDQKAGRNPGVGRNEAISNVTEMRYANTLRNYWNEYVKKYPEKSHLYQHISELEASSANFEIHRQKWANMIDHFDPLWRPPLRLCYNFQKQNLLDSVQVELPASERRVLAISNRLYQLKVPHLNNGMYEGPESIFQDSLIQQILFE